MMQWIPKKDGFFTEDFKKKLKEQNFKDDDIDRVIENAQDALSKTIDPNNPELNNETFKTNLVLGYIQSGKTTSMEAVSCMARDNGFKLMIILSGHVSNLADQTQERIYESLDQFGWNRIQIDGKIDKEKSLNLIKQLEKSDDSLFVEEEEKPAILIVTKKLWNSISKVSEIFETAKEKGIELSKIPTIIFDDEADHYSLDAYARTKKKSFKKYNEAVKHIVQNEENLEEISRKFRISVDNLKYLNDFEKDENFELTEGMEILVERPETTTHRQIKRLRQLLIQHSYLGYTATPVANFLIAQVSHLSPQSATILEPGSMYTGAKYFFGDSYNEKKHIRVIKEENKKDNKIKPESLTEAIKIFLIGVAQGLLNKEHTKKKSRSMLVHPSVNKLVHRDWQNWIKSELQRYKKAFDSKGRNIIDPTKKIDIDYPELEKEFIKLHKDLKSTCENLSDWNDEFIKRMVRAIDIVEPRVDLFNTEKGKIPTIKWGKDSIYARILVGGIGLERGYTISGLTVSYIVRETGTDDTIYQRARFFGYHKPYIGLVRMYLPQVLADNFSQQQENEIIIREKIKEIVKNNGDLRKDLKRSFPFAGKAGPARIGIIENNLKKFPHGGIISDHRAHHLDNFRLEKNREIYNALSNLGKKIKFSEISDHEYASNLKNIDVINNLSLNDLSVKYLKELNYYDDTNDDDYSILTELSDWRNYLKKDDIEIAVVIMNDDESSFKRRVDKYSFNSKDSSVPIESGANKSRPGHAYLHYEFMIEPQPKWQPTPSKDSPYGTPIEGNKRMKANKIATIQLYKFNIHSLKEQGDNTLIENVPYFRLYIPKILGKGFKETKN